MALAPINLFEAVEVVPGGRFNADPATEALINFLNNVLNEITNEVNNQGDTVVNLSLSSGGLDGYDVIGYAPLNDSANYPGSGNLTLQKMEDGQLVAIWISYSSANVKTYSLVKAESPYLEWTSLDGTSASPTTISINDGAVPEQQTRPVMCQDAATQNLYVFTYESDVMTWRCHTFSYSARVWTLTDTVTVYVASSNVNSKLTAAVAMGGWVTFGTLNTDFDFIILRGVITATATIGWIQMINYAGWENGSGKHDFFIVNDQARFLPVGNSLMVLWQVQDSGGEINIAFAVSPDGGGTWPFFSNLIAPDRFYVDDMGGVATGMLLATSGSTHTTTMKAGQPAAGSETGCAFDARVIEGTGGTKVGLLYIDDGGIRYAEYDTVTGWNATANHLILSPYSLARYPFLCTSGGVVRALWLNRHLLTTIYEKAIAYRRVKTGGTRTNLIDWQMQRNRLLLHSNIDEAGASSFSVCPQGIVTINTAEYLPVMFARSLNPIADSNTAICFRLLPIASLDAP
jgi:hypothetical protein